MDAPVVHLYALCWNEERMLPFFFRHCDRFVDRYVILDDHSTDGSVDLLDAHPRVEWRNYEVDGSSFLDTATSLYNEMWKPSRGAADWVVVCNVDELIWHPDLVGELSRLRRERFTLLTTRGYEMASVRFPSSPRQLTESVRWGAPRDRAGKPCVFSPDAIEEIGFVPGRNEAHAIGDVRSPTTATIDLLHYKRLGFRYFRQRSRELGGALREGDRANRALRSYLGDDRQLAREYLRFALRARPVPSLTRHGGGR